ncbi:MAG TPA: sigma 54-interacting transcriptional regulator [Gemmatimonadaceae bacterium]|nr:sigma 54-interacting transcriptional regulator [Gemmatimonadaceae bacterium]
MLTIARVLLAGEAEPSLLALQHVLESAGHAVSHTTTSADAARRIGAGDADVVVLAHDVLPALDRLVEAQCGTAPASFVVVGRGVSAAFAREALRAGATEVVDAGADEHALLVAVERAVRDAQVKRELAMLRARIGDSAREALIGRSAAMTHLRDLVGRAAASRAPLVVTGEAGTGKDVVARLVHDLSERAARPLVTVRCAGADPESLERELFGRAAGEGVPARAGLLEAARGGTIVLEDASALPASLRAQMARASATRTSRRVGAADAISIDARLVLTARVSGTESDAASIEDLIARFNALVIDVPPLRERRSDIPQLVQHFRQRLAAEQGLDLAPLSPDEMLPLLGREWTGNVRELEHWVERSALVARAEHPRASGGAIPGIDLSSAQATLEQLERAYIMHVLALESGHQSRTALRLGIDRRTLYRKLKEYRRAH